MRQIFAIVFLILPCAVLTAQQCQFKGFVVDSETGDGIPDVYVYSGNSEIGTLTNADGRFILKLDGAFDSLYFSHVGYQSCRLATNQTDTVTIRLKPEIKALTEIVITGLSAEQVVKNAIARLGKNHFIEPVNYEFFTRVINYSADSSINFLEEHVGYISQNQNHKSEFGLVKSRIHAYADNGREMLKKYRLISMTEMHTDNMGRYLEDFLHPRRSKNYVFRYGNDVTVTGRACYQILFTTERQTYYKKGTLFIDKDDFGIHKKILDASDKKSVSFVRTQDGYLLRSTVYVKYRDNYVEKRQTLYNRTARPANIVFVDLDRLAPAFTRKYTSDFTDAFWESYNHIPMPKWIENQIVESR